MKTNKLKIGLCFSGGGYRAAGFSLGTLSYLHSVQLDDQRLLDHVVALSTVSGGTITGATYALAAERGIAFGDFYSAVFAFLVQVDLAKLSLEQLTGKDENGLSDRVRSLICAIADVYDRELFHKAYFGELMNDEGNSHLKHISFNATEFVHGLQFRFQWSEKVRQVSSGMPDRGIIGNKYYAVPSIIAANIRMADILAASSCFPGGFEPINFPTDFVLPQEQKDQLREAWKVQGVFPIGLMDGGIVDNQGIEPILLADKRMQINASAEKSKPSVPELDLIIISDVTSPSMDAFVASTQRPAKGWRRLTPMNLFGLNFLVLIGTVYGLWRSIIFDHLIFTMLFTVIGVLSLLFFLAGYFLWKLPRQLGVPYHFLQPLGKLLHLRLQVYESILFNRVRSILLLSGEVFLKQVRRLNFYKVYEDKAWHNRRIMTAIYELRADQNLWQKKIRKGSIPTFLEPSSALSAIALQASSMGTTLWFTPEEIEQKLPEALIATGQFTMCWNLLEYIYKIKEETENLSDSHAVLQSIEDALLNDWRRFLQDPFWLVNQFNGSALGSTTPKP
jgi:hypothetical protein